MKKLLLALGLCLGALSVPAAAKTLNCLTITRTDGQTDRLALDEALTIAVAENGDVVLTHPSVTVIYPMAEVKTYKLGYNQTIANDIYTGDHQQSSIQSPEAPAAEIEIAPGYVSLRGLDCSVVTLHDLRGIQVSAVLTHDGSAVISLEGLPSGVYILTYGSRAVKIKL